MGLRDLFGRGPREDDLQDEISSHLAMAARDRVADGEDSEAARRAVRREFGNVTLASEATKREWGGRWREAIADVVNDIRYAARLLVRSPAYVLVVVAVLAVGTGANAAVFLMAKGTFLKPLPGVRDAAGLAAVLNRTAGGRAGGLTFADYKYVREHNQAFDAMSGSSMQPFSLGLGNRGERVWGELVAGTYFEMLGVSARLGRVLLPSDDVAPGRHPVAVLSEGLWQRAFGADPNIVGKSILLNAYPMTVVGVTGGNFQGTIVGLAMEAFVPLMMEPQLTGSDWLSGPNARNIPFVQVLARPKPNVSIAAASAQTDVLGQQINADNPDRAVRQRLQVVPLSRSPFGAQTYMAPVVTLLGAMGGLLLLIVCANVANLVLVRGITRRGEIAVRLALGASRFRIIRLLLIENLLLAVPAAVAGLLLAPRVLAMMASAASSAAPIRLASDLSIDGLAIAFTVLLACASALFFGFVPAIRSSRVDLAATMKDELSPRAASRGRFRSMLVVSQVAVSLVLLIAAGLVVRSLGAARRANPGFDPANVASLALDVKPSGYDEARGRAFYDKALDELRLAPGIESASLGTFLPMSLVDGPNRPFAIEGYAPRADEDLNFQFNIVSPAYFQTLRIDVSAGRDFDRRDEEKSTQVAIVNETMARRFWASPEQALGKRIRITAGGSWRTVVGVVRDIKYARINEDPRSFVYLPHAQAYATAMNLHVRAAAASPKLMEQVRDSVHALDPNLPILGSQLLADQVRVAITLFETAASALTMFGLFAMALSALGIYGLVSYTVKQSTHEIGIRMAIGAQRSDIVKWFLGRGLRLGALGAGIGVVLGFIVARLMARVLFGVNATDFLAFGTGAAIVLAITTAASLFPSWRASRTDPLVALRHQ